ncbi:MAG: hypothetical protein CL949_00195 [Erythrobacter sp.]|nr:hypothetical protein [Erythrobacter sp.]|tara:strand:- start:2436 stop:2657 length:222 start_codon:yes stop_codon:yes gene_type:complete
MGKVVPLRPLIRQLVISDEGDAFALSMRPAVSDRERHCRMSFPTTSAARVYASVCMRAFPSLYVGLIDETEGR